MKVDQPGPVVSARRLELHALDSPMPQASTTDTIDALARIVGEDHAIRDAEAMTRSDLPVEDEQVERLRSYFDDDGIVELTGLIAFQDMSSKFNSALGVPAQGFCKMPGFRPSRV